MTLDLVPGIARGRILEPEVMDEAAEVKAYLGGVATAYLDRMDDTFIAAALCGLPRLPKLSRPPRLPAQPLRALDVGTGTGSLPVKLAQRMPGLRVVGVDRSRGMLSQARARARAADLSRRVSFKLANGRRLPFADGSFDLVVCNSVLHHIPDPAPVLDEISRVLRRGGACFIRDLRRPHPSVIDRHIRHHGRYYRGTMLRLFADSVRAAFTESELRRIVARSHLGRVRRARVRRMFETYLVIELPR